MTQQLVWQDMATAPTNRVIIVRLKSKCDDIIRLDVVEYDLVVDGIGEKTEWYSPGESTHYASSDLIGWIELPTNAMFGERKVEYIRFTETV